MAIGLCVGVRQYAIAIISSLLVFAILQFGRIEKRIDHENNEYDNL